MSKADKLLATLRRRPPPTDFRWDDLVTLMESHHFKTSCPSGSHHRFLHPSGYLFRASRRHPSGVLLAYQIKEAIEAIDRVSTLTP